MHITKLWTSSCNNFTRLGQRLKQESSFGRKVKSCADTISVTFPAISCSSISVGSRYLTSCSKQQCIDYIVLHKNSRIHLKNRLLFMNSFISVKPSAVRLPLLSARSYGCVSIITVGLTHNAVLSNANMKDVLHGQCACCYNTLTTTDSENKDPDFVTLAKKLIEAGKKINVMAGSVPLIKVVTLLKDFHVKKFPLDPVIQVLSLRFQLLREPESVSAVTEQLLSHGLKPDAVIHILENLPWHNGNISLQNMQKFIDDSLGQLRIMGFTDKELLYFLTSYPQILFVDSKTLNNVLTKLKGLFTSVDARSVMKHAPNVLTDPWNETNEKFDYAYFTMGYKQADILRSHLFKHSLEHIQDRHMFLVRTGFFHTVKEKDDPRMNPNPPLYEVIDSPDGVFVKKFGGMSQEEYQAYLRMREVEREEDNVSDVSDEEDEEEDEKQHLHKKAKKRKLEKK